MIPFVQRSRRANHSGAFLREELRNLLADPPARSGDNGHTAIELAHGVSSVLNESYNRLLEKARIVLRHLLARQVTLKCKTKIYHGFLFIWSSRRPTVLRVPLRSRWQLSHVGSSSATHGSSHPPRRQWRLPGPRPWVPARLPRFREKAVPAG